MKSISLEDFKHIKIKPVLIGWLVGNILLSILAFLYLPFMSYRLFQFPAEIFTRWEVFIARVDQYEAIVETLFNMPQVIAGFVAARYAPKLKIMHAFGAGILFTLEYSVLIFAISRTRGSYDLGVLIFLISNIPIAMVGGFLKVSVDTFKEKRALKSPK